MLRFALASAIGLPLLVFASSTANAGCITNPAICRAICGCNCCTTGCGAFTTPTGRALKRFSVAQLSREVKTIKNDPQSKAVLEAEIDKRAKRSK